MLRAAKSATIALSFFTSLVSANLVHQSALVIATDATSADQAVQILQGYDTTYTLFTVPQGGAPLPPLEDSVVKPSSAVSSAHALSSLYSSNAKLSSVLASSIPHGSVFPISSVSPHSIASSPAPSSTPVKGCKPKRKLAKRQTTESTGYYGLIVVVSSVVYNYNGSYLSALTTDQWNTLYAYQTKYGVRMIQLDVFPNTADFGAASASSTGAGCCTVEEQFVTVTDTSFIPTAGLKSRELSTIGLWHYPATITNATIATSFMTFGTNTEWPAETTAGVINKFADGREQMVFFISGGSWSKTTMYLGHVWFQWGYRGIYQGFRRAYLNTQVDDLFLETDIHVTAVDPDGPRGRITGDDVNEHITWLTSIRAAMNPGSAYFMEFGFNGNGNLEMAQNITPSCPNPIEYNGPIAPSQNLEWHKPLGTGVSQWPVNVTYDWPSTCTMTDPLAAYFANPAIRDVFAFTSHTFTHEDFENATYYDVIHEISYNQMHAKVLGFDAGERWSSVCFIPPAITGLHNGDALRGFLDNGILCGVGDNTRPVLRNPTNQHWPLTTTVEGNGYAGFTIIPRWATRLWYDVGNKEELIDEWHQLYPNDTSVQAGDLTTLLGLERELHTRALLGLFSDPFMFHQANLRVTDVTPVTINGVTKSWSLFQMWIETVVTEFVSLTTWPLISLKEDDMFALYNSRMARDQCNAQTLLTYSSDGKSITGFQVSCANGNVCSEKIPVTVPGGGVTDLGGDTTEQLGSDPMTIWVTLSGTTRSFTLTTPVAVA